MSAARHAPGPWWTTASGVRNSAGYVHLKMHATRYEGQDERYAKEVAEREANECLIAAAPELLSVLQALAKAGGIWPDLLPRVNAVLAKATAGVPAPTTPAALPPAVQAQAEAVGAEFDGKSLDQGDAS